MIENFQTRMEILLYAVASAAASRLDMRIQEARMHVGSVGSFDTSSLPKFTHFSTFGWTPPGIYPKEIHAIWLNEKPTGTYTSSKRESFIATGKEGQDYVEFHYSMLLSSFWWGEPIRLSEDLECVTSVCHFSVQSSNISLTKSTFSYPPEIHGQLKTKSSPPPKPWKVYSSLTAHIEIEGELMDSRRGFIWYKPLYWATAYSGSKITLSRNRTTSMKFNITHVYPVSRGYRLEGLFGFNPFSGFTFHYKQMPNSTFQFT
ncbi:hypothetical protein DSO57_1010914 [Entomophthora muscae]|uniref:Uncharacterized protein n=1 Tax=Entomophthora muscae TaxID=34485 RepID=A0ACC2U4F3_9FUNG|nr:hypothetical protein DSO57_1010914 [Entomophthora muscae]